MAIARPRYMCFPSVVCTGKETKVTVFPRDTSRVFRKERNYQLCVLGLFEIQINHRAPLEYDHPFSIENGCLVFTHTFEQEQEYLLKIIDNDGNEISLPMYAVDEDLYNLRPLKGDLHTHTYYSDGQDGITITPSAYREQGFDFVAITDHNRRYPSELAAELYDGIPLGLNIIKGEEIHTPGSMLHIVNIGATDSVCSLYLEQPDLFEQEVTQIENTLGHIPEEYRRLTAMAKWTCEKIHEFGGMAIFAHPFWCPRRYNVNKEFCDILFAEKIFDAFEVMGGAKAKKNNLQMALWQEQAFAGNIIPVVSSSDSHNHDFNTVNFGRRFTVVFAKDNTTESIMEAVKNGYTAAGELPSEQDDEVRFYGTKLRFVAFAQFLFDNYFPETQRLCNCEGVLMRRYAEGEPVADILASLSDTVENFYKKFYGKADAPVVTEQCQKFLDKAREMQIEKGPITKGIFLWQTKTNRRRE